jgi:hypothetical protein
MIAIYIESADEITTVIERLREVPDPQVALVAPKGAALLQSVVNLKLARKAANDAGKQIVIVSTDPIGKNLCAQLGIPVAANEEAAAKVLAGTGEADSEADTAKVIAGVRIHRYYEEGDSPVENGNTPTPDPIIIPKQMLQEEVVEPVAEPIAVPEAPPSETTAPALERKTLTRDDEPAPKKVEEPREPRVAKPMSPLKRRIFLITLYSGGVAALIIITMLFLFLPFTRVELGVAATDWSKEQAVIVSTQPGAAGIEQKGEEVKTTSEQSVTFAATGKKTVGEQAKGSATLYNYDSTSAVTVPTGTKLTSGGRTFSTTETVSVPGFTQEGSGKPRVPGTKTAAILADDAGSESNFDNAAAADIRVNGVIISSITLKTAGGTSQEVQVISLQDIANGKKALAQKLTDDVNTKMTEALKNRDVYSAENGDQLVMGDVSSTVGSGMEAASGEVKGTATLTRIVIDKSTVKIAADAVLASEHRSDRTYTVSSEVVKTSPLGGDKQSFTVTITTTGKEAPVVPEEALAKNLAGASLANGEQIILKEVPAATLKVIQKPNWWPVKRYPTLNRYITITTTYE